MPIVPGNTKPASVGKKPAGKSAKKLVHPTVKGDAPKLPKPKKEAKTDKVQRPLKAGSGPAPSKAKPVFRLPANLGKVDTDEQPHQDAVVVNVMPASKPATEKAIGVQELIASRQVKAEVPAWMPKPATEEKPKAVVKPSAGGAISMADLMQSIK